MSQRRSKYNAVKTKLDGHTFDSKAEARRYSELVLMQKAGTIEYLAVHPRYLLQEKFTDARGKKHRAINYVADFHYVENAQLIVEDAKGYRSEVFRIKQKLFCKRYPEIDLRILEV